MSIVIIGGNEKMGCPDLLLLFTNTVSHKMVMNASQEAKRNNIPIVRIHRSSTAALQSVLEDIKGGQVNAG